MYSFLCSELFLLEFFFFFGVGGGSRFEVWVSGAFCLVLLYSRGFYLCMMWMNTFFRIFEDFCHAACLDYYTVSDHGSVLYYLKIQNMNFKMEIDI